MNTIVELCRVSVFGSLAVALFGGSGLRAEETTTLLQRPDLFETLRTQLTFYQESVSIRPVGDSGDDGLLRVRVAIRWRTPVDRASAMHTLVVATLVAQPDLTEVR